MMRGQRQATVVVRRRDGTLLSRTEILPASLYRSWFARRPFVRGLVALWEMLILGTRLMLFSAMVQAGGESEREIPRRLVFLMLGISLAFVLGVFFLLPYLAAAGHVGVRSGSLAGSALEGVLRLALFIGYLGLVGRLERMKQVFQYHGAEHKTVNAYEHNMPLTPQWVQRQSIVHVRCGTAFLLWVVVVSIFVFALLGHLPFLVNVAARVVLVPLIAAGCYEILRLAARFYHVRLVRAVMQPGLWLQRLTTREPTDAQVEVAIAALLPVLAADGQAHRTDAARLEIAVYPENSSVGLPS
ncbi:MAG TPA: DUF1385 domain-containing protein [Chloroflexota bacterium]